MLSLRHAQKSILFFTSIWDAINPTYNRKDVVANIARAEKYQRAGRRSGDDPSWARRIAARSRLERHPRRAQLRRPHPASTGTDGDAAPMRSGQAARYPMRQVGVQPRISLATNSGTIQLAGP